MSTVDAVLRLRAVESKSAQRRTTKRHRHIDDEPLVVVAYRMAGESAAPLGIMFGTSHEAPTLLVAPEPRSRQIRFREVLNPFSAAVVQYVNGRGVTRAREGNYTVCQRAPQVIVPNSATAEFIAPLLGRSLRYLRTDGEYAVPVDTVLAGAHLTWLGQQAELPGSSVVLAATELLRQHWVCGLSDLESEDLHVQLGWIDPPAALSGADGAAAIEAERFDGTVPAAGPTPDPSWDRDVLEPLVAEFNEVRARRDDAATVGELGGDIVNAVESALSSSWDATWKSIDLVRSLPPAASIANRWATDRRDFTSHIGRVESGEARFRTRDSVKQAAYNVSRREGAQSTLEASEALDDPLVMARAIGDGAALAGTVTFVEKPWVELELTAPCPVPIGTELWWTEQPSKCSVWIREMTAVEPFTVRLETNKGKTKWFPELGYRAVYSSFTTNSIPSPPLPAEVPWSHSGAESPVPAPEVPE